MIFCAENMTSCQQLEGKVWNQNSAAPVLIWFRSNEFCVISHILRSLVLYFSHRHPSFVSHPKVQFAWPQVDLDAVKDNLIKFSRWLWSLMWYSSLAFGGD